MFSRLKSWIDPTSKSDPSSNSYSNSFGNFKSGYGNMASKYDNNSRRGQLGKYDRLRMIGEGRYGTVYKARNHSTNEYFALKKIFMDECEDEGIPATTIREIALLKQMNHPNIIKLHETFFQSNDLYLVFDLLSSDLKQFMNKQQDRGQLIKMNLLQNIFKQILLGIEYCHSHNILHRDLKPQNILINMKTHQVKIADFGLSRCYTLPNHTWTHEIITLWYRPPEILLGCGKYSIYVDIWSIGCIFIEMLNDNKPIFRGQSEISQLLEIFIKCGTPNFQCDKHNDNNKTCYNSWPNIENDTRHFEYIKYPKWKRQSMDKFLLKSRWKQCKKYGLDDLLNKCLTINPLKRITPKNALKHTFFKANIV